VRLRGIALVSAPLCVGVLVSSVALADKVDACVKAADKGQSERRAGHLKDARAAFYECGRDTCPVVVRRDCSRWADEVSRAIPTLTFRARDAAGHDIVDARVIVDDALVKPRIDGQSVEVDPGPHVVRFETGGATPVVERVVLLEGEKDRVASVTFQAPVAAPAPPPAPPPVARQTPSSPHGPPTMAYVFLGLSVASLGAATYFGIASLNDYRHDNQTCRPNCSSSVLNSLRTEEILVDVFGGVAIVAGGLATWLFLSRPDAGAKGQAVTVGMALLPGGGAGAVGVRFE
jgi:hypothetical protein